MMTARQRGQAKPEHRTEAKHSPGHVHIRVFSVIHNVEYPLCDPSPLGDRTLTSWPSQATCPSCRSEWEERVRVDGWSARSPGLEPPGSHGRTGVV